MINTIYTSDINDTYTDGTIATRLSCVYITFYNGQSLPPYYIGSTFVDNIIDNGYNGSVSSIKYGSIWKQEQKNNKHLFETIILYYFGDREEATLAESDIQCNMNVIKSNLFVNMSVASKDGCHGMDVSGRNNPNYGNRWTATKEMNDAKSRLMAGTRSGEKHPMYNKHHAPSTIEKMRAAKIGKKKGKQNSQYKGNYITPYGSFTTSLEASLSFSGKLSASSIKIWCINNTKVFSKSSISACPYLTMSDLGKTPKDKGFSHSSHL